MKQGCTRAAALVCASLVLGACGSVKVNLWPFGGDAEQDLSRTPAGASAYHCDGGKRLFVRYLENGAAAWVILPEREFRLNKLASTSGTRYGDGSATLEINNDVATLADGSSIAYGGCKPLSN